MGRENEHGRPGLISAVQLAERLGVSVFTIRRQAKIGRFPCYVVGGRRKFDISEILNLIRLPASGGAKDGEQN